MKPKIDKSNDKIKHEQVKWRKPREAKLIIEPSHTLELVDINNKGSKGISKRDKPTKVTKQPEKAKVVEELARKPKNIVKNLRKETKNWIKK